MSRSKKNNTYLDKIKLQSAKHTLPSKLLNKPEKYKRKYGVATVTPPPGERVTQLYCVLCLKKKKLHTWQLNDGGFRTDYFTAHQKSMHSASGDWASYLKDPVAFLSGKAGASIDTRVMSNQITINLGHLSIANLMLSRQPDILDEVSDSECRVDSQEVLKDFLESVGLDQRADGELDFKYDKSMLPVMTMMRRSIGDGTSFSNIERLRDNMLYSGLSSSSESKRLKKMHRHAASSLSAVLCLEGLEMLSTTLQARNTYAVTCDGSTHMGEGYFDVRVRFCVNGQLEDLFVCTVPLLGSHTGENMCDVIVELFETLDAKFLTKCCGFTSDGASNNLGRIKGLAILLKKRCFAAGNGAFAIVWCLGHRVNLALEHAASNSLANVYLDNFKSIVGSLARNTGFMHKARSRTCPSMAKTRFGTTFTCFAWAARFKKPTCAHLTRKLGEGKLSEAAQKNLCVYVLIYICVCVYICIYNDVCTGPDPAWSGHIDGGSV
jgi:hypothetical protein